MSENIGWYFAPDPSKGWDGFNDPGLETFRGNLIVALARETIQNSIDATDGEGKAVKVNFILKEIKTDSIPNIDELKEKISCCQELSSEESPKAEIFFNEAEEVLGKKKVRILEISDYNTTGMAGPAENGTPYFAFVKAVGQSKKPSQTSAGSYGIGKSPLYVSSKVRTIFVSTIYEEAVNQHVQLTQGKSVLMSHDNNGQRHRGTGYWGVIEDCQPTVDAIHDELEWLYRETDSSQFPKQKGTTISILCFDELDHWRDYLAVSVAENFFGRINNGRLEVNIDNKHTIDKNSLFGFFNNDNIKDILIQDEDLFEQFEACKNYLITLNGGVEVIEEETESAELGLCRVKILLGEGLPKKVCFLRNGMFITDRLKGLLSFPDFKDFIAVVECLSSTGNGLLRDMEPPQHNEFNPSLLPKAEQKKGNRALARLSRWVREKLKQHAKDPVSEVTTIDELKDFFGDEVSEGTGKVGEEVNPFGDVVIRAKPLKIKPLPSGVSGSGINAGGERGGEGGGGGTGAGGAGGEGGSGGLSGGTGGGSQGGYIKLNNVRAILSGSKVRKISFTPDITGKISLRIQEAGADTDFDIGILKSDSGNVSNGRLELDVEAGERCLLDVELTQDFSGSVRVVANEVVANEI